VRRLVLLSILGQLLSGCASRAPKQQPFAHRYSPEELSADVATLRRALEEGHAGLYRWRDKPMVDSIFAALADSARVPMAALEFWRVVARALTGLRDGHIAVFPGSAVTTEVYRTRVLPMMVYVDGERLFVRRNLTGDDAVAEGGEIVRINGMPGPEFLTECLRYIPADADIRIRGLRRLAREFELTCAPAFGLPTQYALVVRSATGNVDSAVVAAVSWVERRRRLRARAPADTLALASGELRFFHGDSVAVLAVRSFSKREKYDPAKFIKASFNQLRARNICRLVIDLRGNTGGSDAPAGLLFRQIARDTFTYYRERVLNKNRYGFLKGTGDWLLNYAIPFYSKRKLPDGRYRLSLAMDKPMAPAEGSFTGSVTLLLDGDSFSTSSEFGSVFRFYERGAIVGEESPTPAIGGSGATVGFLLPNTGLDIGMPLVSITMPLLPSTPPSRGVAPDKRVTRNVRQVITGEDPALELAARCSDAARQ